MMHGQKNIKLSYDCWTQVEIQTQYTPYALQLY